MGNRSRYRKLPDLFVQGKEVVFPGDEEGPVVMWMQALNPFEMQECRNSAQAARGRVTMAIKTVGSPEYDIVRGRFFRLSPEEIVNEMADAKYTEWYLGAQQAVDVDPEWAERLVILRGAEDTPASAMPPEEAQLLAELNEQYMNAVIAHVNEDRDYFLTGLAKLAPEELEQDYMDAWTDRRGQAVAMTEFNLSEIYWGARICEALPDSEGRFPQGSHDRCNHHRDRVFENMEEVRLLPEELQVTLRGAIDGITMSVRDAKNSDRQGSSSDSSPLPSTPEESTASTPDETSPSLPGT